MTVLITLTTAGADTGPFDLYSDSDNFVTPFETNVSKAILEIGYTTSLVPDDATTIRLHSVGTCINYTNIVLTTPPPPPSVPCGATSSSGGVGITDLSVNLEAAGGIVIFTVSGQGIPDKFELIHNGVKKATSAMLSPNEGPFDNVYGTEPTNVVPTEAETGPVTQFIGSNKGTVPNRNAAFVAENPTLGYITAAPLQQLVWWKYSAADYIINNSIIMRVTGPSGTAWNNQRLCETTSTTTSSSTTIAPTTTTTTTIAMFTFNISTGQSSPAAACLAGNNTLVKSTDAVLVIGSLVLTIFNSPFNGNGFWYGYGTNVNGAVKIDSSGHVVALAPGCV